MMAFIQTLLTNSFFVNFQTGPLSYFFGLTNNGFVLFHPNYRPMVTSRNLGNFIAFFSMAPS